MSTTVPDGTAVVNPLPSQLGQRLASIYDWAGIRSHRRERKRRVEVTPPVSRYEQVARELRDRILDGTYPPGSKLPSGTDLAREASISQHSAQRALELLEREGLVRIVSGSGTTVLAQRRWHVEVTVRRASDVEGARPLPAALSDAADREPGVELAALRPAFIPSTHDIPGYPVLIAEMTVVASDVDIAVARAWGLVRDALRGDGGWVLDEPQVTARPA